MVEGFHGFNRCTAHAITPDLGQGANLELAPLLIEMQQKEDSDVVESWNKIPLLFEEFWRGRADRVKAVQFASRNCMDMVNNLLKRAANAFGSQAFRAQNLQLMKNLYRWKPSSESQER